MRRSWVRLPHFDPGESECCTADSLVVVRLERLLDATGPWSGIAIKDQSNASAADLTDPLCTFDFPSTLSEFSTTPATAFADSPFSLSSLPTPATTADFPPTPALTPCTDFSPTPSTSASCDKPVRRPKVYWTAQEDELLMSTKEAPLNRKLSWVAIARKAGLGRTGKECRARYLILKDKRDCELTSSLVVLPSTVSRLTTFALTQCLRRNTALLSVQVRQVPRLTIRPRH